MSSSPPEFEIPPTPELSSASSSGSSNDECLFFSALSTGSFSETDFHKDAAAPLLEEKIRSDAGPSSRTNSKNTPQLDALLRYLPPLDMNIVYSEQTTSPMSAASAISDNSQVPLLNNRSRGVTRRASDKGPTSTLERERYVSMLSLPSTPFSRQDLPRDTGNPSRSRTIKFVSVRSVGTSYCTSC
jgi:hypothetical protein